MAVATRKDKEIASAQAAVYQPQKATPTQSAQQPQKTDPGVPSQQSYVESDAVKLAKDTLTQQMAQKPGAYQSQWQVGLNDTMNKILNREKFSYDLNGDALYQQYKDQYINQGQMAMMDTMGQAAALTGGYGNSYAQSVGQQTYQGYLQNLNDKVPELYQLALNQYNQEGEALMNQYGLMADRENQDYGRYRDSVSDWNTEQGRLYQQYLDERNFDYGKYADDRDFSYQQGRDQVADQQWQTQFDEALRQYNEQFAYQQDRDQISDSQWDQSFQYQQDRDKIADSQWKESFQYQQDRDKVSDSQWKESFQYQQNRDKVSDSQWNQSMDYQKDRDKVSDSQWQAQFDEAKRQYDQNFAQKNGGSTSSSSSSSSNSSSSSSSSSKSYDTHGYSKAQIIALQKAAGITADGIWGPQTEKAYQNGFRPDQSPKGGGGSIQSDLNTYIANGASKSEINNYLRNALKEGVITQAEYNKLKSQFAPAGHTY